MQYRTPISCKFNVYLCTSVHPDRVLFLKLEFNRYVETNCYRKGVPVKKKYLTAKPKLWGIYLNRKGTLKKVK